MFFIKEKDSIVSKKLAGLELMMIKSNHHEINTINYKVEIL